MSDSISYRAAQKSDHADILRVIKAAFAEYQGRLDPPSSAQNKTLDQVHAELSRAKAIVAMAGTEMVGCVFYRPKRKYVYLDRLSVVPDWRKRGIGRKLMELVEERTLDQGLKAIRLSVRVTLVENQTYYQKIGYTFSAYHTHSGYTEPTAIVFEKQLIS
jgi:predicted N-acetyltransferase YhbS